jgi:ferrochelatase
MNMGGANNIDEIELFLRNMFADKYILSMNKYLRAFIGNMIVKSRVDEVKENFQKYLNGKSPLLEITKNLSEKLEKRIGVPTVPIMRYVPPFATPTLQKLKSKKIDELILFPMYPQYSTTTTLSSVEDIKESCKEIGYNPKIKVIKPYYDNYNYIKLIAQKIIETMKGKDISKYDLILSAHGLPLSIIKNGDPYEKQIEANLSALKIYLHHKNIVFNEIKLAYQSKVGKAKWLEPNLTDILRNPTNKKVVIYPLSFTIDNSETLFELDIEHREIAAKIGYDDYIVVKCFNDDSRFVELIEELIEC